MQLNVEKAVLGQNVELKLSNCRMSNNKGVNVECNCYLIFSTK